MKLVEIFVAINGHLVGPLTTVLPTDHRGDEVTPADGDSVVLYIRSKSGDPTLLAAAAKLQDFR